MVAPLICKSWQMARFFMFCSEIRTAQNLLMLWMDMLFASLL